MHQRPALHARENAAIKVGGKFFTAQDQSAARAAQGLMRCGCYKFTMRDRRRMQPNRNQPGDMGDVGHYFGSDTAGDLANSGKIDRSRIGRRTADQ